MKTATATWIFYENYGTFLQAYALQQAIIQLGHSNHILDDSFFYKKSPFTIIKNRIIDIIKCRRNRNHTLYKKFKKEHLIIDDKFTSVDEIESRYDAYICGSDQIWSPYLKFNPYYYLGFTDKKKIAYAPSTGTGTCDDEYKKNVKPVLEKFAHIAVREEAGAQMLSSFISKDIKTVLDPTLLLTQKEWKKVETTIDTDTPYILCYFLTPNKWYLNYVKEYARRHNKTVKIFNTNPLYKELEFDIVDAGPSEFITYIKNAEKVFTDSFHSSIFSILYHKDFITFKRFKDGGKKDQNARIANLFKKLEISSHFIGEEDLAGIETLEKPHYNNVETILEKHRNDSKEYLRNAIEN